jgi:hypothetical protein
MTENYASKRERWQKQLDALPDTLRGHISLRNVEAVSALSAEAQQTLVRAIQAGLNRLPRAIETLRHNPQATVAELLEHAPISTLELALAARQSEQAARKQLADLVQLCYPDMPRLSAEALSEAEALAEILQVVSAHEGMFVSTHLHSDFVVVIFHGCLRQALERLEAHLAGNPAFQQAVSRSGLNHPFSEVPNA